MKMTHKAHRYRIAPVENEQKAREKNTQKLKEPTSDLYCVLSALDTHDRL